MPDEATLREQAREALRSGKLPTSRPSRMFGGKGSGHLCALCVQRIGRDDPELEMEIQRPGVDSDVYRFHVRCFAAWDFERTKVPGGST